MVRVSGSCTEMEGFLLKNFRKYFEKYNTLWPVLGFEIIFLENWNLHKNCSRMNFFAWHTVTMTCPVTTLLENYIPMTLAYISFVKEKKGQANVSILHYCLIKRLLSGQVQWKRWRVTKTNFYCPGYWLIFVLVTWHCRSESCLYLSLTFVLDVYHSYTLII